MAAAPANELLCGPHLVRPLHMHLPEKDATHRPITSIALGGGPQKYPPPGLTKLAQTCQSRHRHTAADTAPANELLQGFHLVRPQHMHLPEDITCGSTISIESGGGPQNLKLDLILMVSNPRK